MCRRLEKSLWSFSRYEAVIIFYGCLQFHLLELQHSLGRLRFDSDYCLFSPLKIQLVAWQPSFGSSRFNWLQASASRLVNWLLLGSLTLCSAVWLLMQYPFRTLLFFACSLLQFAETCRGTRSERPSQGRCNGPCLLLGQVLFLFGKRRQLRQRAFLNQ